MRLLKLEADGELSLTKYVLYPTAPYAILSHRWGADEDEVNFEDLRDGGGKTKKGYQKLLFCGKQAARDGLEYFWVDTCCINKASDSELMEAINSMFRWYCKAATCYVYLADVSTNDQIDLSLQPWEAAFRKSQWFSRGWTLQELIAPPSLEFFCSNSNRLGDKKSLERQLHQITGIPVSALRGNPLSHFSFDERLSWAEHRETMREEDLAYSLLGILEVSLPIIYGEGKENAFRRLNREWKYRSDEDTSKHVEQLGAWQNMLKGHSGVVWSVAFSPDSKLVASTSGDMSVRLWEVATGALQRTLKGHNGMVWSVAFSPNLRLLASASEDMTVRLWDVATGALQHTLKGYSRSVVFSPDSRLLALAPKDNIVQLWDTATGDLQQTLEGHSGKVWSVAFSPDSKLLASTAEDMTVRLWDMVSGVLQQTLEEHSS